MSSWPRRRCSGAGSGFPRLICGGSPSPVPTVRSWPPWPDRPFGRWGEKCRVRVRDLASPGGISKLWMQGTGCRPGVRVFQWPGSVFGARCPAFGVDSAPVPGTRSQVSDSRYPIPGTRYLAPVFEKPAHGVCIIQDAGWGRREGQRPIL